MTRSVLLVDTDTERQTRMLCGSAAQMQEVFGKVGFDDSGIWLFKLPKYYEVATDTGITDKIFGFADLGLVVDVPLKFIPPRLGKWTFSGAHISSGWVRITRCWPARRAPTPSMASTSPAARHLKSGPSQV